MTRPILVRSFTVPASCVAKIALAEAFAYFGHKKTGALAGAPVFSIIGSDIFVTSLIFHFFL